MAKEMTKNQLIKIGLYYVNNNLSLEELAKKTGFSEAVIARYFNREREIKLPDEYQKLVDAKKKSNWIEGKTTYGNDNKQKLNNKQKKQAAYQLLTQQKTLTQLANELGVSRTTLYKHINTPEILGETVYWSLMQQKNDTQNTKGK